MQDACEDLGQRNPGIHILEEGFTSVIVLFLNIRDERWLLTDKQVQQPSQDSSGVVDSQVRSLAEEIGQYICLQH